MKRIEESIKAFKLVAEKVPKVQMLILGKGSEPYSKKLKDLVKKLSLEKKVKFVGFVNEKEKIDLLKKAWILISTSLHEGWGINIIEAAACGTPAVTYRVPGLVDSVQDQKTGLICQQNSPEELAKNLILLLSNSRLRLRLSNQALSYSRQFTWEKAAKQALQVLFKAIKD